MDKRRRRALLLILLGIAILAAGFLLRWRKVPYAYSGEAFGNPMMGNAPCAWYMAPEEDVHLLYADVTWRELEPEEGLYDWAAIEQENQLERWRQEGKHIVLRFVCDVPGDTRHMDIPDWLYEKTGQAGDWYSTAYGQGFSPDYAQDVFIEQHAKAVAALGQRYGQDGLVAFVELGSLGHWGEWHAHDGVAPLPPAEVREQYILPWLEAFPQAKIMMRRPFASAAAHGLGLFNDMFGHAESTETWLGWIEKGGTYDQTGEADALTPMPDAWKYAPIGGELTSSMPMSDMLEANLADTMGMLARSHATFLGPKVAPADHPGYDRLLMCMGYRLWISELAWRPHIGGTQLSFTWHNAGTAPFYFDWPVVLYLLDGSGQEIAQYPLDVDLTALLPGNTLVSRITLPLSPVLLRSHTLQIGICDPMTNRPSVRLAMETPWQNGCNVLLWE